MIKLINKTKKKAKTELNGIVEIHARYKSVYTLHVKLNYYDNL